MFRGEDVCRFLESIGYSELYHANAASTALSFLENGKILSRSHVEAHPQVCWQTRQPSDATDKRLGVFNDVFFDRGFKFKVQHPVLGYWRLLKKLHRVS